MKNWMKLKIYGTVTVLAIVSTVGTVTVFAQSPERQSRISCAAMTNLFLEFDMSPMQVRDYLAEGGTLEGLADERQVNLQSISQQWKDDMYDCTTAAVSAGAITPERGDAILAALEDGSLTPFPIGDGRQFVDVQGVFMPGGWGMRHDSNAGNQPNASDLSQYDSPNGGATRPRPDGVFSPGGWGWVDRPDFADIKDADWIGHPYYQGVFSPGGWGVESATGPNGVFHPGGWGYSSEGSPDLYSSPGNDTIRTLDPSNNRP